MIGAGGRLFAVLVLAAVPLRAQAADSTPACVPAERSAAVSTLMSSIEPDPDF